jgi:hypothetical protein
LCPQVIHGSEYICSLAVFYGRRLLQHDGKGTLPTGHERGRSRKEKVIVRHKKIGMTDFMRNLRV